MTRILLRGGRVHADGDLAATALCVEDGTIVWTGGDEAALAFEDGADRVVELSGRLVTPAFVDAHAHLAQTGFASASVDLSAAASLHEALDMVGSAAHGSTAAVVLGFGWDDTTWPEQRPFTRDELDRATDGRAAMLSRVDVHSAVVSSAFLDAAARGRPRRGVRRQRPGRTRRPPRGSRRASSGCSRRRTGRTPSCARCRTPRVTASAWCTSSRHLTSARPRTSSCALLSPRAPRCPRWSATGASSCGIETAIELGCAGAAGDLCMDGSIGSRTTALCAPYADADTAGHLYLDAGQVAEHVVACTRAGMQAGFHVIGDRAVAEVVAGFEAAAEALGRAAITAARHRLEHVEMTSPQQMRALAQLGVTASMQPMFDAYWGGETGLYAQRLGSERAATMNAFGSMSRAGVPLAFGSDSPVTPFEPWAGMRAATHHQTPSESVDVAQAFEAYTRGGWRAARRDDGRCGRRRALRRASPCGTRQT